MKRARHISFHCFYVRRLLLLLLHDGWRGSQLSIPCTFRTAWTSIYACYYLLSFSALQLLSLHVVARVCHSTSPSSGRDWIRKGEEEEESSSSLPASREIFHWPRGGGGGELLEREKKGENVIKNPECRTICVSVCTQVVTNVLVISAKQMNEATASLKRISKLENLLDTKHQAPQTVEM